ncbi:MAG: HPr kinase/phosphorylase [Gemmatimonadota bacterium]|nr:MAG: HPr kinase/phosphorylase [Gemmatimonadota bacterium]
MEGITVEKLIEENRERLDLELLCGKSGLSKLITRNDIHRPGLALAGFVDLFAFRRVQILGNAEIAYLRRLSQEDLKQALETLFRFDLPCVIITNANDPPGVLREIAERSGIALLRTSFPTTKFVHLFNYYLDDRFAPQTTIHGSLVDVYGVGLLFTGRSSIGKSEIALDLVERGHRLVADDVVTVTRSARGLLLGSSNDLLRHHIEIRGVGIIDVRSVFGVQAIRLQKRIEVEVQLVDFDETLDYERLGIEEEKSAILEVEIPQVTVPIFPGKNITVIAEVIALNYLLKIYGYYPAKEFSKRLHEAIRSKTQADHYFREDTE